MNATEVNEQTETIQKMQWTKVITPKKGWFDINLSNLWKYRDLIMLFVKRDFVAVYKQTILGPLWFLLQPLFTTIVFTVIFGKIAQIPTDGLPQPLFYMCGIVTWNYFANCLNNTSDTFIANANIFGKVYFPRLTVPVSVVITNLITFGIQFVLFLSFLAYFYLSGSAIKVSFWFLLTPFLLLQMAALGLGLGILISSLTTKYRDLRYVVGFGVQLWMYATPIVYPMSQIPEKWQWMFAMNPMAAIVETARFAFLGAGSVHPWNLGISLGMTALVLCAGIVMFSRIEKTFMDTV
jgi:lipopolysaccharide transport system permease protein